MAGKLLVGLIRGINVGTANRVSMADLRALLESLGYANARTLLNSGNVVFSDDGARKGKPAARIEAGMASKLGVETRVVVLSGADLALIVRENTLEATADNPSRLQVVVTAEPADVKRLAPLQRQSWGDEALAVGSRAAYLWCPRGVTASALFKAVGRALGDSVTARNWATVRKLHAMIDA